MIYMLLFTIVTQKTSGSYLNSLANDTPAAEEEFKFTRIYVIIISIICFIFVSTNINNEIK